MSEYTTTPTLDMIWLELSQFVSAKTNREIALEAEIERLRKANDYLIPLKEELQAVIERQRQDKAEDDRLWNILVGCVKIPKMPGESEFDLLQRALSGETA